MGVAKLKKAFRFVLNLIISKRIKKYAYTYIDDYLHRYFIKKWRCVANEKTDHPRLLFGTDPIINFSYWSKAMTEMGFFSKSVVKTVYNINKKEDFDIILNVHNDHIIRSVNLNGLNFFLKKRILSHFHSYLYFDYFITNFDIYHISYSGIGVLPGKYWELEIDLIKNKGGKIVVLPYGSDWIQYSRYSNSTSFKHGLLAHYPAMIALEEEQHKKITYLNQKADIIIGGANWISKVWHLLPFNYISMDETRFSSMATARLMNKGKCIKIAHSPNHRLIKGTEFLIDAVEQLNNEGYNVELLLLEKMKNDEVLRMLKNEADILVDQLLSGYALSAIEGMAAGLPVISNLEDSEYDKKVYRRFSYLDECPILSASPESIKETIKILINNPDFAAKLGQAGKEYVAKYHSKKASQYMFSRIYDKIWYGKDVDLMTMYHPLYKESYNNQSPKIEHPLVENKIPAQYLNTLKK